MKIEDISKIMENMDERHIRETVNYKPKSRNITRIIALAACIAIIVTAIPAALVLNREDVETDAPVETTPIVIETTEPDKGKDNTNTDALKVIYCSADMLKESESVKSQIIKDPSAVLGRYNRFYDERVKYSNREYSEDIPLNFTITLGNQKYECEFDHAYNTQVTMSKNETLKSLAGIACYKIDQEADIGEVGYSGEIRLRVATKEIVYVSVKRIYQFPSELKTEEEYEQWRTENLRGNLTHEDLKVLADKDMKLLYGEDALSTYTYDDYNSGNGMFWYQRTVNGFPTAEQIYMKYTSKGELLELEAENLGVFDAVETDLSADKVIKADAEALEIINEEFIKRKRLVVGKDEELYVYYVLDYTVDGKKKVDYICYKVE